jgi:hypothetical protein
MKKLFSKREKAHSDISRYSQAFKSLGISIYLNSYSMTFDPGCSGLHLENLGEFHKIFILKNSLLVFIYPLYNAEACAATRVVLFLRKGNVLMVKKVKLEKMQGRKKR